MQEVWLRFLSAAVRMLERREQNHVSLFRREDTKFTDSQNLFIQNVQEFDTNGERYQCNYIKMIR